VSPGAATDGVTLFFLKKKLTTFFVIALWKAMTFLAVVSVFLTTSIFPRLSGVLYKFSHKKIILFGSQPLDGVTRGGPPLPRPLLVTPLATFSNFVD